ncbi:hypothetical protein QBC47DRAFT_162771 [Echria macrotheca]|uniref:HMG box domain-containing protein n=1 Tax=Echria macrotheca TaxID=438768 RepID=A0AAJ0BIU5_9PEZI|nr:hypothetical protein QBC47DRAFT_162771 [Echria macrotheca]
MLSAIGLATARQLRASSGVTALRHHPVIVLPIRTIAVSQRSFSQSSFRPASKSDPSKPKAASKTKKPASPKKKAAAPKAQVKREPTPKQLELAELRRQRDAKRQERQKAKDGKEQVKRLIALSLIKEEPKLQTAASVWSEFLTEQTRGAKYRSADDVKAKWRQTSEEFTTLSEAEKERLAVKAAQAKAAAQAAYRAWVVSKTPLEIYNANQARVKLRTTAGMHPKKIEDDRLPKRAPGVFALFTKSRWASGDLKGTIKDNFATINREWKALSEAERKPFHDLSVQLRAEYEKQARLLGLPVQETYFVKSEE